MTAVLGGVVAALAWGSADFVARFTGGAVGHVRALFGMLTASAVVLSGVVYVMDLPIADTSRGWWLVLLTGVGLTVATLLLYQGLVRGPVSIVAPIAGTFPAFNILLALILGIRPGGLEWLAMATVIAGVVIVARSAGHFEARGVHSRSELRRTVFIAIAASFGFAVTVAAGQEAGEVYGDVQAVFLGRWVSLVCCVLLLAVRREMPRIPPRWWPALAAQGVLDGAALVAVVAGSQGAASAVTAVLASTFSAVTVVLARLFMREVMSRGQWLGIGLIIAGVMTLSGLQS
jgi:drug/metabolite transporter (DMT)-like permease